MELGLAPCSIKANGKLHQYVAPSNTKHTYPQRKLILKCIIKLCSRRNFNLTNSEPCLDVEHMNSSHGIGGSKTMFFLEKWASSREWTDRVRVSLPRKRRDSVLARDRRECKVTSCEGSIVNRRNDIEHWTSCSTRLSLARPFVDQCTMATLSAFLMSGSTLSCYILNREVIPSVWHYT